MDKLIVAIDSTKTNVLQMCARKYDLAINNARSPLAKPDYMERGSLMHEMLKQYYILKKHRTRWAQSGTTHEDVIKICIRVGEYFAIRMQLDPSEVSNTIFQFIEYARYYEHDGWDRIVAVEQVGTFVLYEDDEICILYEIKPDLVVQLTNALMPIDHKTAKKRKQPGLLSNQFMSYCFGLGVNNLVVNKIGFQKTLVPHERFNRHTLSYPDDVLTEWRDNTVWWVKQLLRHREEDYWPANLTSCDKYSGCVFREACVKERIAREYELMRSFELTDYWDVGKELEE